MNCFVGSALSSRPGGAKIASSTMIAKTANEAIASMNIWFGQKRPCGSFLRSVSTGGPAEPLCRKTTRWLTASSASSAGISQTCKPKKRLIVSVPMPAPPLRNCWT